MKWFYIWTSVSWFMFLLCCSCVVDSFIKYEWGWAIAFIIVGIMNGFCGVLDIIEICRNRRELVK
jgi:hypothetical protein